MMPPMLPRRRATITPFLFEVIFYQNLGNLNTVQGRALAHVIGHHPEIQTPRTREVLAAAADINRIVAGGHGHRSRISAELAHIDNLHDGRLLQYSSLIYT